MKLLDTFCGAGGAGAGYARAGFEVVGVDIVEQPHYPFPFVQGDALALSVEELRRYDVVHASPPCQAYSVMSTMVDTDAERLIGEVRAKLQDAGVAYVIENVERAPLEDPVLLCGSMFDLAIRRHRLFETWPRIVDSPPAPCACHLGVRDGWLIGHRTHGSVRPGRVRPPQFTEGERRAAIGAPWIPVRSSRQAIPPAYTRWIGARLRELLEVAA